MTFIDLRSDTVTKPTQEMRRAMAEAEVGDDVSGEDPTVNRLQEIVAELLGKEAALFLPSGTMCNQVAFSVHCRAGDEIILHETAHPLLYEAGGPAALIGAVFRPLTGERGRFTAAQVREAVRPAVHYMPRSRVVSIEQTANIVGGVCWPVREVEAVADQLIVIGNGKIVAQGSKQELLAATGVVVRGLDPAALHEALADAGLAATPGSDGALLVEAEAEAVGRAAAAAGVVLLELRPADTGGLEELFLSLTSTGREEALIS